MNARAGTWIALPIAGLMLAGCEAVPVAFVDLQTDKVVVQAGADDKAAKAAIDKAWEGCAMHGRKPRYLSEQEQHGVNAWHSVMHYLFACVE